MTTKPSVLFVTYGGGHVSMVIPVAQRLLQEGKVSVLVLALTTSAGAVREAGLPVLQVKDFVTASDNAAMAWGAELAAELPKSPLVDDNESFAYLGLSFADLVEAHGLAEARKLYAQYGRHCFLPVQMMRRILSRVDPDLVVMTNSPRAEQAAGLAAASLRIPALCINSLFAIDEIQWIGQRGFCQKVCVLNNAVKNKLLKSGRKESEIAVTGNPSFDALTLPKVTEAGARLRADLPSGSLQILLWASQAEPTAHPTAPGKIGDPALPETILWQLLAWAEKEPGRHVLLRPHPNESLTEVVHPRATWCGSPKYDIGALLHASDLVVTMTSTVAVQAYSVGLPVVQVRGSIFDHSMPLAELGIARECYLHELETTITQTFYDTSPIRLAALNRPQATASVVTEILNLLFEPNSPNA